MYFEATFHPSNPTEYNADAEPLVGKRISIQQGWILEDGPYQGELCYYIPNTTIGTIPTSHLDNIEPIAYSKWRTIHSHLGFSK